MNKTPKTPAGRKQHPAGRRTTEDRDPNSAERQPEQLQENKNVKITNVHDKLFRKTFSVPEEAVKLFKTLLGDMFDEFDWNTLQTCSTSFVDDGLRGSEADLLFKVDHVGGDALGNVYILLEHLSKPDPRIALRALKYTIRIWERELADGREKKTEENRLPHVFAVVFYQGKRDWNSATDLVDLSDEADWQLPFRLLLRKQTQLLPGDITATGHAGAAQLLLMAGAGRHAIKAAKAAALKVARIREGEREHLETYLLEEFDTAVADGFFDALIEQGTKESEIMKTLRDEFIEQGEERGIKKGRSEILLRHVQLMLAEGCDWEFIERISGLDETRFMKLREQFGAVPAN